MVAGFGLIGLAGWWLGRFQPEPMYEGRSLMEWAPGVTAADDATREASLRALRTLGTNAVPALIRIVQERESALSPVWRQVETRLPARARRWFGLTLRADQALQRRATAIRALGALGPAAAAAADTLGRALRDPSAEIYIPAASALGAMGRPAAKPLATALLDAPDTVKPLILTALAGLGPEAAEALPAVMRVLVGGGHPQLPVLVGHVLRGIGPNSLLPLLRVFANPEANARQRAAATLTELCDQDYRFLSLVTGQFHQQDAAIRRELIQVIGQWKPEQRPVLTTMARALQDADPEVRKYAEAWIRDHVPSVRAGHWLKREPPELQGRVEALLGDATNAPPPPEARRDKP